jgi:iron complex outermembrane receptor protein
MLSLSYRFNEDVSTYFKYSRGFKPGHFNAQTARPVDSEPAGPESLDSFEWGMRGRWFEGRLSAGAAFFYYLYEGYQVFLFTDVPGLPPTLEVVNANNAENYGSEVDMRLEPLAGLVPGAFDGLVMHLRVGWLESQFVDFQNVVFRQAAVGQPFPVTIDFTGNRLPNSPQFTVSGSAQWSFDFGRWGAISPRYDFAWTDDVFFDAAEGRGSPNSDGVSTLPPLTIGQGAFWLHNLRLSYRAPSGNMEVAAWVRNLTDTTYKTFAFDASQFQKVVLNFVGQPRTIGIDISFSF